MSIAKINYMLKQAITQIMFLANINTKAFYLMKQDKIVHLVIL
jgi:hypothetical protein